MRQFSYLPTMQNLFRALSIPCPSCSQLSFPDVDICMSCGLDLESLKVYIIRNDYIPRMLAASSRMEDDKSMFDRQLEEQIFCEENADRFARGSGVYIVYGGGTLFKIGRAVDVVERLKDHECGSPVDLCLLHVIRTNNLVWCERFLQGRFSIKHKKGEWYSLSHSDLEWLFSIVRLDEPKTIITQQKILEFLDTLSEN
jgi:hypothetical protein